MIVRETGLSQCDQNVKQDAKLYSNPDNKTAKNENENMTITIFYNSKTIYCIVVLILQCGFEYHILIFNCLYLYLQTNYFNVQIFSSSYDSIITMS